ARAYLRRCACSPDRAAPRERPRRGTGGRGAENFARGMDESPPQVEPRSRPLRSLRSPERDDDRHAVDLTLFAMPVRRCIDAGCLIGFELNRQRLAADECGVLFERFRDAVADGVAHADPIGDVESSLLAGLLNNAHDLACAPLGDQLWG